MSSLSRNKRGRRILRSPSSSSQRTQTASLATYQGTVSTRDCFLAQEVPKAPWLFSELQMMDLVQSRSDPCSGLSGDLGICCSQWFPWLPAKCPWREKVLGVGEKLFFYCRPHPVLPSCLTAMITTAQNSCQVDFLHFWALLDFCHDRTCVK